MWLLIHFTTKHKTEIQYENIKLDIFNDPHARKREKKNLANGDFYHQFTQLGLISSIKRR